MLCRADRNRSTHGVLVTRGRRAVYAADEWATLLLAGGGDADGHEPIGLACATARAADIDRRYLARSDTCGFALRLRVTGHNPVGLAGAAMGT